MTPNVIYTNEHNPQIGDIWASSNGWHILLVDRPDGYDDSECVFNVIYLEDGVTSRVSLDWFAWTKVA
jgi:hypothetical protein